MRIKLIMMAVRLNLHGTLKLPITQHNIVKIDLP